MLTATQSKALDTVMANYDVHAPDEVRAFLEERPRAAEVLVEAIEIIPKYFPEGRGTTLRVRFDPEGEEPPYVGAYARTSMPPQQTLDALRRLWFEWFSKVPRDVREAILISSDPI